MSSPLQTRDPNAGTDPNQTAAAACRRMSAADAEKASASATAQALADLAKFLEDHPDQAAKLAHGGKGKKRKNPFHKLKKTVKRFAQRKENAGKENAEGDASSLAEINRQIQELQRRKDSLIATLKRDHGECLPNEGDSAGAAQASAAPPAAPPLPLPSAPSASTPVKQHGATAPPPPPPPPTPSATINIAPKTPRPPSTPMRADLLSGLSAAASQLRSTPSRVPTTPRQGLPTNIASMIRSSTPKMLKKTDVTRSPGGTPLRTGRPKSLSIEEQLLRSALFTKFANAIEDAGGISEESDEESGLSCSDDESEAAPTNAA